MNIKKRHEVIGLLFLAGVINYLDRSALSVAAPLITKDLHFSPSELGFVFSSFFNINLLKHVSPIEWENVILYGQYVLNPDGIR
jgi:hypothetical protein